jgi:hypothetical protein
LKFVKTNKNYEILQHQKNRTKLRKKWKQKKRKTTFSKHLNNS